MADTVNAQTVDAVMIDNLKNIAGASAVSLAMMYQDQAASRNRSNILAESLLAKACHKIQDVNMQEAAAESVIQRQTGDSGVLSLLTALNAGAIGTKTMAITPPETGVSRAFGDLAALSQLVSALTAK
jgi:uncharacterized membrane protein YdbT with pleckstrin-like domain